MTSSLKEKTSCGPLYRVAKDLFAEDDPEMETESERRRL